MTNPVSRCCERPITLKPREGEDYQFVCTACGQPCEAREECGYCGGTGEVACSSTNYMPCPRCSREAQKAGQQ